MTSNYEVRISAEDGNHPLESNLTKDEAMATAVEWLGRPFDEWELARDSATSEYGGVIYIQKMSTKMKDMAMASQLREELIRALVQAIARLEEQAYPRWSQELGPIVNSHLPNGVEWEKLREHYKVRITELK